MHTLGTAARLLAAAAVLAFIAFHVRANWAALALAVGAWFEDARHWCSVQLRLWRGRHVHLGDVDDDGAELVARALAQGAPRLEVLGLSGEVSDAGGVALVDALRLGRCPMLRELHLSGNRLSDETAEALAEAIDDEALPQLRVSSDPRREIEISAVPEGYRTRAAAQPQCTRARIRSSE